MYEELFEKANLILEKYNDELKSRGITCTLSEKDFRTNVDNLFDKPGLLDSILYKTTEKREKKLYKGKRNKYFTLVITFSPSDKKLKVKSPKSYAFITKSIARNFRGFAPKEKFFDEDKILNNIEKCIVKFLRKAENKSPEKICKSSFSDNLRYLISDKYSYQKTVFGKNRVTMQFVLILTVYLILTIFIIADIFIK